MLTVTCLRVLQTHTLAHARWPFFMPACVSASLSPSVPNVLVNLSLESSSSRRASLLLYLSRFCHCVAAFPSTYLSSLHFRQCCQMAKFDSFLSLDCARVEGGNPRKGRDQILPSGNTGKNEVRISMWKGMRQRSGKIAKGTVEVRPSCCCFLKID